MILTNTRLNGSRAQGILFLLEELNVPYDIKLYHRVNGKAPRELVDVHPLGKSPVVTITPSGGEPFTIAETPFIAEYIASHFGSSATTLQPKKWKDGQENKVGGETDEWMRYQYIMYYAEGSFMAMIVMYFVLDSKSTSRGTTGDYLADNLAAIRGPKVPFFIRPMTRMVSNMVISALPFPTLKKHFKMLDGYLADSKYLCGDSLTSADVVMAFGMVSIRHIDMSQMGEWEKGTFQETYPNLWAYAGRMEQEPAWQKSVKKIEELEGSYSILPN